MTKALDSFAITRDKEAHEKVMGWIYKVQAMCLCHCRRRDDTMQQYLVAL